MGRRIFLHMGLWLACAMAILTWGCENDDASLVNKWGRHVTDSQGREFDAAITFGADGVLRFELLSSVTGHTDTTLKYRVEGDRIVFYDDPECGMEGWYRYDISGSTLTLTAEGDSCEARMAILHAEWTEQ